MSVDGYFRREVERVMAEHPLVNAFGYGLNSVSKGGEGVLERERAELAAEESLERMERLGAWVDIRLRAVRRVGALSPSSYWLKHVAARDGAGYAWNGQMIVVMLTRGFPMRVPREAPVNPLFGVSQASLRKIGG